MKISKRFSEFYCRTEKDSIIKKALLLWKSHLKEQMVMLTKGLDHDVLAPRVQAKFAQTASVDIA